MSEKYIYKLCTFSDWVHACTYGSLAFSAADEADGFVHLSTASQVTETAHKHYRGQQELVLLCVEAGALGDKLVYEPSRGGALFPHLYAPLKSTAIVWVKHIASDADGVPRIEGRLD